MKTRKPLILVLLAASMYCVQAGAVEERYRLNEPFDVVDGRVMYSVGGGSVVGKPITSVRPLNLGVGISWHANLMCGNFDLQQTIRNQLNGAVQGFKNLMSDVLTNATGAVASLPAMLLQRSNPGLYELISNGIMQGRIDFDRSKLTCNYMSRQLADMVTSSNWGDLSTGQYFQAMTNSGNVDAVSTTAQVEANKGQTGVQWVDGSRKGGAGQDPIKIVNDITMAGYNALNRRTAMTNTSISSSTCDGGALCTSWPVPQDAANWAVRVLGEHQIRTCQNCEPMNSTAGEGLTPLIQETYVTKLQTLSDLMTGAQTLNSANLAKAGSDMLPVTRRVIEALRDDPDQELLARRLASETAMSDVLGKALLLQRMLQAGARNPNAQTKQAQEAISGELQTLSEEIASLKLEMDIRQGLASNAATAILRHQEAAMNRSRIIETGDPDRDRILQMSKPVPGP